MKSQSRTSSGLDQPGGGLALAVVALLFVFHAAYGAMAVGSALILTMLAGLALAYVLLRSQLRQDLISAPGLGLIGAVFCLVLVAAGLSMTPYAPGGPHPAFAYSGGVGAASLDPSATAIEMVKLSGMACLFLVGMMLGRSNRRARLTLTLLIQGGAVFSFLAFLAFAGGWTWSMQKGRLDAGLLSPNTAATLFGVLLILGVEQVRREAAQASALGPTARGKRVAWALPLAAAAVLAICLAMTASRAGLVSTAAAALLLAVLTAFGARTSGWIRVAVSILVALLLVAAVTLGGDLLLERFASLEQDIPGRTVVAAVHWRAFLASPLSGYGLGSFETVNAMFADSGTFRRIWGYRMTHNVYLQWLEEAGIIGTVPMFALIGLVMVRTVSAAFSHPTMGGWLRAMLCADLVVLIHGTVDFAVQTPSFAAFWALLLGLQWGLAGNQRRGG
jgi:O-antigen ligase